MKIIDNKIGGEIPMGPYDSCRLIHLNLKSFIEEPFTEKAHLNEELLYETAYEAMRLADDLVELEIEAVSRIINVVKDEDNKLEYELWNKINNTAIQGRRAGLGFTAMGDAIAMLGLKYDSEDGLKMVNQIMKIIFLGELDSEIDMAIERGTFPAYDGYREWHLRENNEAKEGGNDWYEFIRTNFPERANRMSVYGRRNLSFNTVAPTGTVSLMARCSSGIEPIFMPFYQRKRKCMSPGDRVDYTDIKGEKYTLFVVVHPGLMQWASMKYGKTEEELNKEWTIKEWEDAFKESPYYGSTAPEIDWRQRVKLQGIIQKYITHSISSCLIGDESHLIHTSNGLKYIEDIGNHIQGFSSIKDKNITTINHEGKCVNIDEFYTNGEKETIKIELKNGTTLQGTPNHKLLILGDNYAPKWVELFNLREGDYIIGRKGLECFGNSQKTISTIMGSSFVHNRIGAKTINIPKRVSRNLARLIGYIISDGFLNSNGIGLSQMKNNVIEDFINIVKSEFGIDCKLEKDNRSDNLYIVHANSRILRDFFTYLGMDKKCYNKDVPKIIYEGAGRQQTAEFIKGLTLDGYVDTDKICIMTSVNKRLLLHIQVLLNQFGIESNIIQCKKECNRLFPNSNKSYHTRNSWMIYCTGENAKLYNQYIGFAEERKQLEFKSKFKGTSEELSGDIPDLGLRNSLRAFRMTFSSNKANKFIRDFSSEYKNGMSISRDNLLFLSDLGIDIIPEILLDNTYMFIQVSKKEYDSIPKETFDLHIKEGHSYIVNGIISHNTVNLDNKTTEEEIANIYIEAWKEGLKGITIYRDGCREGVLTGISNENNKMDSIPSTLAPKRPKELEADYYQVKVKGEQFIVVVGLMDGKPYEIFAFRPTEMMINFPNHKGKIIKVKKAKYSFESDKLYIPDLKVLTTDIEERAATLYSSMLLRHGVDIEFIIKTAKKVNDNIVSFSSAMCRILSKYVKSSEVKGEVCPECGGKLVRDGGCIHCQDCGWSRCS